MNELLTVGLVVSIVIVAAFGIRPLTIAPRAAAGRFDDTHRDRRRWTRPMALLLGMVGSAVMVGPVPTVAVFAFGFLYHRTGPRRAQRRRRRAIERELPDVMDLLTITIRAGLTPRQAVEAIADAPATSCTAAFAEVVRRTQRGQPFADALAALPSELGPGADGITDAIAACDRYGLPLGPLLEQIANEARATRRRLDQADARRLPVKLSFPLVACTLPSFVLLAIAPAVIAALSSLEAW